MKEYIVEKTLSEFEIYRIEGQYEVLEKFIKLFLKSNHILY